MSKLALKMYRHNNLNNDLLPLYGEVVNPERDIHHFNKQSVMNVDDHGYKSGFATIGIDKKIDHKLQQREIFEDMLMQVLRAGYDDAYLVKVLGDRFIEDDAEYPGPLTRNDSEQALEEYAKEVLGVDIATTEEDWEEALPGYDFDDPKEMERFNQWAKGTNRYVQDADGVWWPSNHINGYDIQRDATSEFRARDLTPLEIIDYVRTPKDEIDEMALLVDDHIRSKAYDKKDLLRELRDRYKVSPYSLKLLAQSLPNTGSIDMLGRNQRRGYIKQGLIANTARKIVDEVFKQEDQYVSDLRTKMLIPAVKRRYD